MYVLVLDIFLEYSNVLDYHILLVLDGRDFFSP